MKAEFTPVVSCPQCGADIRIVRHRDMTPAEAVGVVVGIVGFFVLLRSGDAIIRRLV